jgi:predicted short-subunit dehydrogenase-like oxidoreductase (DUF2520 family)
MPKQSRKVGRKPTVSVVGAGRLGTALAMALASCGYRLEAVVARRQVRARRASNLISSGPVPLSEERVDELPASELVIIATPDDVIAATARRLASFQKGAGQGRTVLHTSGALSSDILSPLAAEGFHVGSLHPLVSVSDPAAGAANLRAAFYCLEGDRAALRVARAVVRDLGGKSFPIDARHKALYHAAAVMASGHLVALSDIATEMLVRCGLDQRSARRVLLPLIESTIKNLLTSNPARALTGTFARGDLATVQRHLVALHTSGLSDALKAYKLLGRRSLELAKRNGAKPAVLKKIANALKDEKSEKP